MTPNPLDRRFGIHTGAWLCALSAATLVSIPAGIIGAVRGSDAWVWLPIGVAAVFDYEFVAALRREVDAMDREARNDELAAVIGGPLPDPDDIDLEWLELHRQRWSEKGPQ